MLERSRAVCIVLYSTRDVCEIAAIVSEGRSLLFPRFTLRALTTSGVPNRAVPNRLSYVVPISVGAWPDRQKLVTQKLDTHPAHQERDGEVVKVDRRRKKEKERQKKKAREEPTVSRLVADRQRRARSRWIDFNMVLGHV